MKISVSHEAPEKVKADLLVVPRFADDTKTPPSARALDQASGGLLRDLYASGDVSGKLYETSILYPRNGMPAARIMSFGLGARKKFTADIARSAMGKLARSLPKGNIVHLASLLPGLPVNKLTAAELAGASVEGLLLGLYRFTEYKTKPDDNQAAPPQRLTLLLPQKEDAASVRQAVSTAEIICDGVLMARNLISRPGAGATPSDLAAAARRIGRLPKVRCSVLDRPQMQKLGMGGLLGVARGSQQPPKFIILDYGGARRKQDKPVVLVGKGITFDSGGLSIKPAASMELMKYDMAGGAAVLGALQAIARLNVPLNVVGIVPATENLPSGTAYKPGDVLKTMSGQTIEVLNTDAEGRLILSDALAYACRYKPAAILDAATLTGACIVALGDNIIGMMGNDEALQEEVRRASEATGERVWPLPLWDEFSDQIKSDIADWKNIGGRSAGTITAAALLSKFVESYPWVHLDIAGPAWTEKDKPYVPKGASGVGVRLFVQFVRERAG